MQFIRADKLKKGMRLARPIYNRYGVLLFERNSKLNKQTIESVRNFGLLGVYILEPAEPVPPMTKEDMELERFQTMAVFSIKEELENILVTQRQAKMPTVVSMILRNYGSLSNKIQFCQSLRSKEDYIYKHSLNVAILCAMMLNNLKVEPEERMRTLIAALVHDIGKLSLAREENDSKENSNREKLGNRRNRTKKDSAEKDTEKIIEITEKESEEEQKVAEEVRKREYAAQMGAMSLIENSMTDGMGVRRICMQALNMQEAFYLGTNNTVKASVGAKVLLVANRYDELTAMRLKGTADSEVKAIQKFREYPEVYDPKIVNALLASISILFPGVSVELSNKEKALVLIENEEDILRPTVLNFRDNQVVDLSLEKNKDIYIIDIMKTLDNRCIIDKETLRKAGYPVPD